MSTDSVNRFSPHGLKLYESKAFCITTMMPQLLNSFWAEAPFNEKSGVKEIRKLSHFEQKVAAAEGSIFQGSSLYTMLLFYLAPQVLFTF